MDYTTISKMTNPEKARLLFIFLIPLPYPGAGWTRIEFLAASLKNYNYDVKIVGAFSAKTIRQAGSLELNGIKIYNVVPIIELDNFIVLLLNVMSSLLMGLALYLAFRPRLSIISVPSGGNALGFYIAAQIFRSKVITDYRDEWEDYFYHLSKGRIYKKFLNILRNLMSSCYQSSNAVVTVTDAVADSLKKRGIEGVIVVPNGADVEIFKPKEKLACRDKIGIPRDSFALIYTGYVGSYYRLNILLDALKQLDNGYTSKTILVIVGHGVGLQSFLKLAVEEGVRENVFYLGKIIDKTDLVNALCASDVGIVPYDSKPLSRHALPVKSLEYLACGLPVIAATYKDSLLGQIMIEHGLGIVAEPENLESLCEAISRLRENVDLRINVRGRGLSFVRQNYDRNKIGVEFHSIVLSCLKPNAANGM